MSKLFPPLKKNHKPGLYQIGFFVRTPPGNTLEYCNDGLPEAVAKKMIDAWLNYEKEAAPPEKKKKA
jgi:hypothetical protein